MTELEARVGEKAYYLTKAPTYRPLHAAMVAAGVGRVDIYIEGTRYSSMDLDTVARCAGMIRELGGHEDGR